MKIRKTSNFIILAAITLFWLAEQPLFAGYNEDRNELLKMQGCFRTDYNFAEKEILNPEYSSEEFQKNSKRYDATATEWIGLIEDQQNKLVFQRIMLIDMGAPHPYAFKHHAEEWTYEPTFTYDYLGGGFYSARQLEASESQGQWKRDTKSLDDGTRYQCVAGWTYSNPRSPSWTCQTYSPIPGRETRDMKRKDYQGLERRSELKLHSWGWKELQWNEKVWERESQLIPFVSELGTTTYTRINDSECEPAIEFWNKRKAFWKIARQVWSDILNGHDDYSSYGALPISIGDIDEKMTPRYEAINLVAENFSPGFILEVKQSENGRPSIDDSSYSGFEIQPQNTDEIYQSVKKMIEQYRK